MKLGIFVTAGAMVWLLAASPASADVQVTMQDGKVSVVAKDATLRQIMSEWARVGQTKVVNIERIPGGPVTLELRNIPEDQALDILMRPLSGYVAAPRAVQSSGLSRFDRILVMPTVAAARQPTPTASAPPPPVFQTAAPTFQAPGPVPQEENDEQPGQNPTRGPVFTAFPQPQVVNPNAASGNGQYVPPPGMALPGVNTPPPSAVPTAPIGVSVPGMPVPTPPPATPNSTVRRPGGL